jgi:hypothetical protein
MPFNYGRSLHQRSRDRLSYLLPSPCCSRFPSFTSHDISPVAPPAKIDNSAGQPVSRSAGQPVFSISLAWFTMQSFLTCLN